MTGIAVLRDGLLPVGRRVPSVMAAEAPRIVRMTEIVGICAPCHTEIRKYIAVIDRSDLTPGSRNRRTPLQVNGGIVLLIKLHQGAWNSLGGLLVARVAGFQQLNRFLLQIGQSYWKGSESHSPIHRALRQFETMPWPVVAIHALHGKR